MIRWSDGRGLLRDASGAYNQRFLKAQAPPGKIILRRGLRLVFPATDHYGLPVIFILPSVRGAARRWRTAAK